METCGKPQPITVSTFTPDRFLSPQTIADTFNPMSHHRLPLGRDCACARSIDVRLAFRDGAARV